MRVTITPDTTNTLDASPLFPETAVVGGVSLT